MSDEAPLPPALDRARYGKPGKSRPDKFVGLWVHRLAASRQGADARRVITDFFTSRDVAAAIAESGEEAVGQQLTHAAGAYFATCLRDPQYSSTMLGLKRLPIDEVRGKVANEAVATLATIDDSRSAVGPAAVLPSALIAGYREALGETGEQPLQGALAKKGRSLP